MLQNDTNHHVPITDIVQKHNGSLSLTGFLKDQEKAMRAAEEKRGNPVWEEIREVAEQAGRTFLLNVTLNRDKAVTGVFAGDLDRTHAAGCAYAMKLQGEKAVALVTQMN